LHWRLASDSEDNQEPNRASHADEARRRSLGGLYIHRDAVIVAARMLGLDGYYPCFNISKSLIRPNKHRLKRIETAGAHQLYGSEAKDYKVGRWTTYRYDELRISDRELARMENRVGMVA